MKKTKLALILLMALTIPLTILATDIGGVFTFNFALGSSNFYEPYETPKENAPESLPKLEGTTWEQVLAEAITNFQEIPAKHAGRPVSDGTGTGGSIWYSPKLNDDLINILSPETKGSISKQLDIIMRDYQLQTDFYNWIKPHFLQAFRQMEDPHQGMYLQALNSMSQYVQTMDYSLELYFLDFSYHDNFPADGLLNHDDYGINYNNECSNTVDYNPNSQYQFSPSCNPAKGTAAFSFYLYAPTEQGLGHKPPFRKLHTWVFFQIHNGPMMRWEWRYWLQKTHQDFSSESHKLGKWNIAKVPNELPELEPAIWQKLLIMGLNSFYHNPHIYDCPSDKEYQKDATMVYGALAPENFWPDFKKKGKKEILDAVFTVMRSEPLREITYNWAKEPYTQAFISLPAEHQQIYVDMLEHGEKYLPTYNYEAELAFYKKLEAKSDQPAECTTRDTYYAKHQEADYHDYRNDCEVQGFVYTNRFGQDRKFPKLEAWYFRQIYNNRMTLEELKNWNKTLLDGAKQAQSTTVAMRY